MRQSFYLVAKFLSKSRRQQMLLVEATVQLILARLMLILLPTRVLIKQLKKSLFFDCVYGNYRVQLCKDISWAVDTAANRLSVKMVCFPRAMAAQSMLRRRKICTTLYYGIARLNGSQISAHVWLQDGNQGIIGHTNSADFNVLFCCPEAPSHSYHITRKEYHHEQET